MSIWITILKLVLSAASSITKMMADKQLLDAGRADAMLKGLENVQKEYALATAAGNAVNDNPDGVSDPFDRSSKTSDK